MLGPMEPEKFRLPGGGLLLKRKEGVVARIDRLRIADKKGGQGVTGIGGQAPPPLERQTMVGIRVPAVGKEDEVGSERKGFRFHELEACFGLEEVSALLGRSHGEPEEFAVRFGESEETEAPPLLFLAQSGLDRGRRRLAEGILDAVGALAEDQEADRAAPPKKETQGDAGRVEIVGMGAENENPKVVRPGEAVDPERTGAFPQVPEFGGCHRTPISSSS